MSRRTSKWPQRIALLIGLILATRSAVALACAQDPDCTNGNSCVLGACCKETLGTCVNNNSCCASEDLTCNAELPSNTSECCIATSTACRDTTWGGAANCCNSYFWASQYGTSTTLYTEQPTSCQPFGGGDECLTCPPDGVAYTGAGTYTNGLTATSTTACCTGYATKIAGATAYCASNIGQGCGGISKDSGGTAHTAFCWGSAADPTKPSMTAAWTECSTVRGQCCILDTKTPCHGDYDCCSVSCNLGTNTCNAASCSLDDDTNQPQ
ncbi:MAG: hypothetical protein ACREP9_13795, partial [Candidatus Dormibacteraceae bacterium]